MSVAGAMNELEMNFVYGCTKNKFESMCKAILWNGEQFAERKSLVYKFNI